MPNPGTRHRKYLEENLAADSLRLDPAQIKSLDEALATGKVPGRRYPDWVMVTIDR